MKESDRTSTVGDVILLEGIEIPALLGVTEGERRMRRPVRIDLEVGMDLRPAGEDDDLESTLDYQVIYDVVEQVVSGREHKLVEALGERVANALFEKFSIDFVNLTVRKPKPVSGVLDWAGIQITRRRNSPRSDPQP